jgi:hypothetical protein
VTNVRDEVNVALYRLEPGQQDVEKVYKALAMSHPPGPIAARGSLMGFGGLPDSFLNFLKLPIAAAGVRVGNALYHRRGRLSPRGCLLLAKLLIAGEG